MRCDRIRRILERRAARGLSPRDEQVLSDHLSACRECAALEDELDRTWRALEYHPSAAVSAGFLPQLRARLRAEKPEPPPGWIWRPAWGWPWAALTAGITLAVVVLIGGGPLRRDVRQKNPHANIAADSDRRDDQFLEDLEQTLQYSAADALSAFDSWPFATQESAPAEPSKAVPAKKRKQKEPS